MTQRSASSCHNAERARDAAKVVGAPRPCDLRDGCLASLRPGNAPVASRQLKGDLGRGPDGTVLAGRPEIGPLTAPCSWAAPRPGAPKVPDTRGLKWRRVDNRPGTGVPADVVRPITLAPDECWLRATRWELAADATVGGGER